MRQGRFRHLPVLVRGHLVGMVSDRKVTTTGERTISRVMRTNVVSVTPDTTIEAAARLMLENKIGALPVIETEATSWQASSRRVTCSKFWATFLAGMARALAWRSACRTCLAN